MHRREEARDYGLAPGVNQDLANPNALNRPFAWPMMIKSSMNRDDQVGYQNSTLIPDDYVQTLSLFILLFQAEITDLVITAMEKFHYEPEEICYFVKVTFTFYFK